MWSLFSRSSRNLLDLKRSRRIWPNKAPYGGERRLSVGGDRSGRLESDFKATTRWNRFIKSRPAADRHKTGSDQSIWAGWSVWPLGWTVSREEKIRFSLTENKLILDWFCSDLLYFPFSLNLNGSNVGGDLRGFHGLDLCPTRRRPTKSGGKFPYPPPSVKASGPTGLFRVGRRLVSVGVREEELWTDVIFSRSSRNPLDLKRSSRIWPNKAT